MNIEELNSQLKESENWIEIYSQKENIYEIYFSIQFDSNLGNPSSIVIVKDNYKFTYFELNKNLEQYNSGNAIVTVQEIDFKNEIKNIKNKDLIGVHHYNFIIYICFKNSVYIYNLKNLKVIDFWNFDKEPLKDLYIFDKNKYYYLIFLTGRNVYFSKSDQTLEDQVKYF